MKVYTVGNGVKSVPLGALESLMEWGVPWHTNGEATPRTPVQLLAAVAFLYRAVDLRANAVATMPWAIYRGTGKEPVWDSQTPVAPEALLPFASLPELLTRTEAALTLVSEAFWFRERSRVRTTGLRWLDPTTMDPIWEPSGLVGFRRSATNGALQLPVDDVVYIWRRGLSETDPMPPPAQAGANAAHVLWGKDEFAKAYFKRGAIKAGLLTVDGNPLPAERARLKSWWQRLMGGLSNAFNAEVVSAAVTYVPVGEGLAELANKELSDELRESISTALGVPHSMLMSNASTYATAQQDTKTFYETTIVPECRLIETQVNAQVFEPAGLRFRFLPSSLDAFQQDENERATAFAAYVNAGIKPSIVAQMLGLELPEGIEYDDLDPEPQPVELAAAPLDAQNASEREEEPEDDKRETERKRFRTWARKRKHPDPDAFKSDLLSDADKEALLGEMRAPFSADSAEWNAYP
jgi:hypothetical protein